MGPDAGGGASSFAITFDNANVARAVRAGPRLSVRALVDALQLASPTPILLVIGGAESLDPTVERRLERLFERGVVRAAAETGSTLMDGGTASGVMAVLGRAVAASDASAPYLGIAPAGKVTFEGDERDRSAGTTKLEPNHTNFILANSDEWGGETSLLFEALDELSTSRPAVAVLAGGGPNTIDEVRLAIERRMRIVVIEGTGGLADELASIARSKTKPQAGDPVGAIVIEGDLTFVSIDVHATDLERVLLRDLRMDETLREAWRQQRIISAAARQQRRDQNVAQLVALTLGLTVTALVVVNAVLDASGYLARNPLIKQLLFVAILVLPIMVAALAAATGRWRPGTRWILLRASSEAIKREIWRYRARAGTYSHARTRRTSREVKLAEAVGSSIGGLMRTDVSQLAFDPATDASVETDKLTAITPDQYIVERIDDQIAYYLRTAAKLERRARLLRALALAFGAIGTFLAAIGLQIYVALTTAIVGACITIVESRQLETSVTFYNQAAADLAAIRAWWFALAPSEQRQQAMIDRLVERSERIMRAELTGWVQEMQDAMTQFRLDQSADRPPTGQPGAGPGPVREAAAGWERDADADAGPDEEAAKDEEG
jgi:hypothetical protein